MVSVATKPHVSRNSLFFRADKEVELLRSHKNWSKLHRICGMQRLYFDDFEKLAAKKYSVSTYTIKAGDLSGRMIALANGQAATMIGALTDVYIKSHVDVDGADQLLSEMQNNQPEEINTKTRISAVKKLKSPPEEITDDEDLIG